MVERFDFFYWCSTSCFLCVLLRLRDFTGLIPIGEENTALMKCLMISKVDGSCRRYWKCSVCNEPRYQSKIVEIKL